MTTLPTIPPASPDQEYFTISAMAEFCNLANCTFRNYIKSGHFPEPIYDEDTPRKPYYDRVHLRECLEVRRTQKGVNGKRVLFNKARSGPPVKRRPKRTISQPAPQPTVTEVETDVLSRLVQLAPAFGLEITRTELETAVLAAYPDGIEGITPATVLRNIEEHL